MGVGFKQSSIFVVNLTHQYTFKQSIFFLWQRIAGGHFCSNTKIGGLLHPVNLISTTKPRGHKRRSRSWITWSFATILFRRKCCFHGAAPRVFDEFSWLYFNKYLLLFYYARIHLIFIDCSLWASFKRLHTVRLFYLIIRTQALITIFHNPIPLTDDTTLEGASYKIIKF